MPSRAAQGTNIPGFGQRRAITKSTLTVNETHMFGAGLLNEARFGRTMQDGGTFPAAALNPADFGIANGVNRPLGLPQMVVAGALSFGGPATLPQGRKDTLYVFNDTLTYHRRPPHGEGRRRVPPLPERQLRGGHRPVQFSRAWPRSSREPPTRSASRSASGAATSPQDALSFFAQDAIRLGPSLTIDLGLRYEWHMTPTERDNQFVVFDAATASLLRVGVDVDKIYRENNDNIEPRLGLAWTVGDDGRTVVRAAYGSAVDQPGTTAVNGTAGNPPFATPLSATGAIPLSAAVSLTQPIGLAPATVDPGLRNASLRSWNVNLQRQLGGNLAATVGYFGFARRRSADLAQSQPAGQRCPSRIPTLSATSPIRPGATARQHHAGGEHRLLPLSRAFADRHRSGCRRGCCSIPRTPGPSRSTPIRSTRRTSTSRTATTSRTSTDSRTSTRGTVSC